MEETENNTITNATGPNRRPGQGADLMKTSLSHSQNHSPTRNLGLFNLLGGRAQRNYSNYENPQAWLPRGKGGDTYDLRMIIIFL